MNTSGWWLAVLLALLPAAAWASAPPAPTGLQRDVVFTVYPHFADNAELLRRLVSPLHAYRIEQQQPGILSGQPLAPTQQHFALYVPSGPPPAHGYALLVFVPPWKDARVPLGWIPALDRHHMIFVSAADSGNAANVIDHRVAPVLLAAYGVMQRYPVDPAYVYVGGFSGGSRVALRIALGYPDLFHGALLDAGSDPIGTRLVPLPPAGLMHRFQQASRIVFLTGEHDYIRQAMAARTRDALQHWCVFDRASITLPRTGHALASAGGFSQALDALDQSSPPDARQLAACRARNAHALDARLTQAHKLLKQNQTDAARKLLERIDARFGGLAAPHSVVLMQALDTPRQGQAR